MIFGRQEEGADFAAYEQPVAWGVLLTRGVVISAPTWKFPNLIPFSTSRIWPESTQSRSLFQGRCVLNVYVLPRPIISFQCSPCPCRFYLPVQVRMMNKIPITIWTVMTAKSSNLRLVPRRSELRLACRSFRWTSWHLPLRPNVDHFPND